MGFFKFNNHIVKLISYFFKNLNLEFDLHNLKKSNNDKVFFFCFNNFSLGLFKIWLNLNNNLNSKKYPLQRLRSQLFLKCLSCYPIVNNSNWKLCKEGDHCRRKNLLFYNCQLRFSVTNFVSQYFLNHPQVLYKRELF